MKQEKKLLGLRYKKNSWLNKGKLKSFFDGAELERHNQCPCCGHDHAWLIAEIDREKFPCQTVVCKQCDFVFNNYFISNFESLYQNHWAESRWRQPEKSFLKRTKEESYAWARFAFLGQSLNIHLPQVERVLEIGCGDGANLYPYHLIGKKVTGLDFDENFLAPGQKRGMDLRLCSVEELVTETKFDLILLIHSFEHVVDLAKMVKTVKFLCHEKTKVYVEVPGIKGLNRKKSQWQNEMKLASGNDFLGYLQYQHNYHFDKQHLVHFWQREGFDCEHQDEWVRAIFKPNFAINEGKPYQVSNRQEGKSPVIEHLMAVEKDFTSIKNLVTRGSRTLLRGIEAL